MILLNPGPVTLSPRVRRALTGPDMCHREPEFGELQSRIRVRLREVYDLDDETWCPVLIAGSGTAAVEAMLTSLCPRTGNVLVVENGVYGERMSEIARVYSIGGRRIELDWGQEIDLAEVDAQLAASPELRHVAVVHHETTTGRLNDLFALAELCERHDARLLLDGVSSFGAEAIPFESPALAACAATANKCLHGVPGVSFVLVRRSELPHRPAWPRSLYLDLARAAELQDGEGTRFTPAIPAMYALDAALEELREQGGWKLRHQRYASSAQEIAKALEALGFEPLLPADRSSVVLRSYRLPHGLTYEAVHAELKRRGFTIYAGQGKLYPQILRISTMGDIAPADIERLLASFREICSHTTKRTHESY